eukprot:278238_1
MISNMKLANSMLICWFLIVYCINAAANTQPNFIFILADDQAVLFNETDAAYMPNLNKYIIEKGITFNNAYVSTPVCCPSRTETIAARNFQNIGAPNGTCFNIDAQGNIFNNSLSLFTKLKSNGYITGTFGKLTNDQANYWCNANQTALLKGFSRINCPCKFDNFYGLKYFDLFLNGTTKLYSITKNENAYETSVVGNATIQFLKEYISDDNVNSKPFMIWIGPHSPHLPATPAAWNGHKFNNLKAPRTSNFNMHVDNHHTFVSNNPAFNDTAISFIDQIYRDRIRSMISVDDIIGDIFKFMEHNPSDKLNINNTYVIYNSDHGFHLGQWRIPTNKYQLYETDINVPLYITGPNIYYNNSMFPKKVDYMVGNIDYLPTFLELANINYNVNDYDGRSFAKILLNDNNIEFNRTVYLTQYRYILDVYIHDNDPNPNITTFGDVGVWYPNENGQTYPGQHKHPPCCNESGVPYITDSLYSDNWRGIRIRNNSHNAIYAEFVDFSWNENAFQNPNFFEYYDLNKDPFQIDNLYINLTKQQQNELHKTLMDYGQCKGTQCW